MPLALGMVPAGQEARVLAALVADIRSRGDHVTAGDVGFHHVRRALAENGRSDVLHAMPARTDAPSYGAQTLAGDRKSVMVGKRESVQVNLGGPRIIK